MAYSDTVRGEVVSQLGLDPEVGVTGDADSDVLWFEGCGPSADEATLYGTYGFERLLAPFEIVPRVVIPEGDYSFPAAGVRFLTHSSRPVSVRPSRSARVFTRPRAAAWRVT